MTAVVSCGYPTPVFQTTEHDFDPVASFVIFDGPFAGLSSRDEGRCSHIYKGLMEPICVITLVSQQAICRWQATHQGSRTDVIAHLTGGHENRIGCPLTSVTA